MSTYNPDYWKIVKMTDIKGDKSHYRVLCSWAGSYLYGSSWKLSSGIEDVTEKDGYYIMPQNSGSVYQCNKNLERVSGIMAGILNNLNEQYKEDLLIELIDFDKFMEQWNNAKSKD